MWSLLGVILLELSTRSQGLGWDDFFTTMIVNLCIGVSMLFVPFATKSLLNDGLTGLATSMSAAPSYAAIKTLRSFSKETGVKMKSGALRGLNNINQRVNQSRSKRIPKNLIKVDFKNKRRIDDE